MNKKRLFESMEKNKDKLYRKDGTLIRIKRIGVLPQEEIPLLQENFNPMIEHELRKAVCKFFNYSQCNGGYIVNGVELHTLYYVIFPHYPRVNGVENPLEGGKLEKFIDYLFAYLNETVGCVKELELFSASVGSSSCFMDFGLNVSIFIPQNNFIGGWILYEQD